MTMDSKQSDRELLELAAKAAGIGLYIADNFGKLLPMRKDAPYQGAPWNPLTDDGDALRLAAKLGMVVDIRYGSDGPGLQNCVNYWIGRGTVWKTMDIDPSGDQMELIRRAIVRAAAAIGMEA